MKQVNLILVLDESKPFIFRKVYSDQQRFMQIMLNFLSNSLKFTKNADIRVHLKVLEEQNSDPLEVPKAKERQRPRLKKSNSQRQLVRTVSLMLNENEGVREQSKYVKIQIIIDDQGSGISKEGI